MKGTQLMTGQMMMTHQSLTGRRGHKALPALAMAAALYFTVSGVQAQQLANLDNWMNFDSKNNSWAPGFDRSFAPEVDQQPARGYPSISEANIEPMKAAIKRYSELVENGGWNMVPEIKMRVGTTHPAVIQLRRRLQIEGDLAPGGDGQPDTFDYYVEKAVKTAQVRHGLAPTGIIDKETLDALNVPASAILRKLRTNLTRIKQLSAPTSGRYVFVNIPAAQIEAIEDDQVVSRHIGVVGKIERQTPILQSEIREINFNKEWILPPTVIREDLLPKARREGIKAFDRYGVDIYRNYNDYLGKQTLDPASYDWNNPEAEKFFYAQAPGLDNPLGFLTINFANSHAAFMHDTPGKELFTRNYRAESSGCIRVQNVQQLAAWLLRDEGWDLEAVNSMKQTRESLNVPIRQPVKLYFAYVTAWATPDGVAHFRPDIYGRDGVGVTATVY
ncbi:MAG: L,D-transpeptidase family protein [Hyphomicrobiales bacterium]|nr:L,D-transpeptidase family protein [Hyphomicrobiales bacterium]